LLGGVCSLGPLVVRVSGEGISPKMVLENDITSLDMKDAFMNEMVRASTQPYRTQELLGATSWISTALAELVSGASRRKVETMWLCLPGASPEGPWDPWGNSGGC
jgi:hypothetical protein